MRRAENLAVWGRPFWGKSETPDAIDLVSWLVVEDDIFTLEGWRNSYTSFSYHQATSTESKLQYRALNKYRALCRTLICASVN